MKITIPDEIKEWAFWLSSGVLGEDKIPLCPWAKKSIIEGSVDFWEDESPENLIPLPEEIKVRIVHMPNKSPEDLIVVRNFCNTLDSEFIFLDSHPEDSDLIGGIKSVSILPLILIQRRKEIEEAREILKRGKYYNYWDKKVLDDLMNI
jgi:hypothetical protein